jgi:hypothetical protein
METKRQQVKEKLTAIEAARKAVEAYERAVQAVEKAFSGGPAHGRGTAVMRMNSGFITGRGKCSECEATGEDTWKFCAYCGAEIVRFEHPEESATKQIAVHVETETLNIPTYAIHVKTENEKPELKRGGMVYQRNPRRR